MEKEEEGKTEDDKKKSRPKSRKLIHENADVDGVDSIPMTAEGQDITFAFLGL
jgi:hypothetical protein